MTYRTMPIFTALKRIVFSLLLVLAVCATAFTARAQTLGRGPILTAVNAVRLANGLAPLAPNPALETAAQVHSDDMARKGYVDHVGSDGSSAVERISAAGYPAWSGTRVWGEVVYAGNKGFDEAMTFFMSDDAQRRMLLNGQYREIGIGQATAANAAGVQTMYWTLVFGAQPNVLPIFVNDGATLVNVPQVAIHLTQENAVPGGEGSAIGTVLEVRVSAESTFKGVDWRKWEALIPFTFDTNPGLKTVYVQMRDGGGRTTISTTSVQYDPNSTPQVAPLAPGVQVPITATGVTTTVVTPIPGTATPYVTLAPLQTPAGSSGQLVMPVAQVTAMVLIVTPPTPVAPTAIPPTRAVQHTLLDNSTDVALPDWLAYYLLAQSLIILVGVIAFFRMKR
jgi:hypothetical protein